MHGQLGAADLTAAVVATAAGHQILGSTAADAVRRAQLQPVSPAPAAATGPAAWGLTEREADDLVRDADRFLALVEESLGLTRHLPVGDRLARVAAG